MLLRKLFAHIIRMVALVTRKMRDMRTGSKPNVHRNAKCSMTPLADTKHIFIERKIYLWRIEFCIWLRQRAVHMTHAGSARYEIINSLRSRPSAARFARTKKKPIRKLYRTRLYRKDNFKNFLAAVSGVGRLKAQRKFLSKGRREPLGTNSHLTIPGG